MDGYMTVKEASMKWGISERQVQVLCKSGKIEGVSKIGRSWLIPSSSEKPKDHRITTGKYRNWRKQNEKIDVEDVW